MSSTENQARSLTKLVRRLNHRADTSGLPRFLAMTDGPRRALAEQLLPCLPAGGAVVLREYDHPDRTCLALKARAATRRMGRDLAVAGSLSLAVRAQADGLHLPEAVLKRYPNWPQLFRNAGGKWVSVAVHNRAAARFAADTACDIAIISPLFPTASHPGQQAMSATQAARLGTLAKGRGLLVLAMGGISAETEARRLRSAGAQGIAGISLFLS